ncbi:MAG: ABC transporter permease, partial [Bacteroidota bacterium]
YCYFTGAGAIKYKENSLNGGFVMGSTPEYFNIQDLELEDGRFLSPNEFQNASNAIMIGNVVKNELFGDLPAVGKDIKMYGRKWRVIGVLQSEGDNPFNFLNFDDAVLISLNAMRRMYNVGQRYGNQNGGQLLSVQAKEGVELAELKSELTGILRSKRRLKPTEDDDFALNEASILADVIGNVFGAINIAGIFIGIFALIVGMISVANIMFVSVKERTGLIGVKKALGAKKAFILTEFLLESIFLCILGGLIGLFLVFLLLKAISSLIPFELWMSPTNVIIGVVVSVVVGIISGVVPAFFASRMDPVVAMRG